MDGSVIPVTLGRRYHSGVDAGAERADLDSRAERHRAGRRRAGEGLARDPQADPVERDEPDGVAAGATIDRARAYRAKGR